MSRSARDGAVTAAVLGGLAGAFVTAVAANHPARGFDRVRRWFGEYAVLVPDWRFFAPVPSVHDNHLLYRVRTVAGERSAWRELDLRPARRWWSALVNPGQRRVKGLHDLIGQLTTALRSHPLPAVERSASYAFLVALVAREARRRQDPADPTDGFQLAVIRSAGYDDRPEPDYLLLSAYVSLAAARTGPSRTPTSTR